jgi:putative ABC transport system permease protein
MPLTPTRLIIPLVLLLSPARATAQDPAPAARTIAIDERLAAAAGVGVGDRVVVSPVAGQAGETVVVAAITRRGADPSDISRGEYRVRLHLDHLQRLTGAREGDRVGRFAVLAADSAVPLINAQAFGFRAHRAADVAVETSATFRVVNRFHRAIGVITIVASAIFLLCITLLKVDERRRDIGALRLLGISRATVVRSVVLESSVIALAGSAMGAGIGWAASGLVNWYYQGLYATPLRFTIVTPGIVLFALGLSLLLGVGAGLVAAQRLVRRAPLDLVGR